MCGPCAAHARPMCDGRPAPPPTPPSPCCPPPPGRRRRRAADPSAAATCCRRHAPRAAALRMRSARPWPHAPLPARLLLDALCDVHLRADAVDAHVGGVGGYADAAEAAEPAGARARGAEGGEGCVRRRRARGGRVGALLARGRHGEPARRCRIAALAIDSERGPRTGGCCPLAAWRPRTGDDSRAPLAVSGRRRRCARAAAAGPLRASPALPRRACGRGAYTSMHSIMMPWRGALTRGPASAGAGTPPAGRHAGAARRTAWLLRRALRRGRATRAQARMWGCTRDKLVQARRPSQDGAGSRMKASVSIKQKTNAFACYLITVLVRFPAVSVSLR